ncbi:MAG: hypothetical protein KBH99_01995 [Syntrophobacteraceae bacterium]|nr:hypothetical protein [Syntrophobacteraceae bacterium]
MNQVLPLDQIQSDALNRNMDLTNVKVVIPEVFEVLREAVKGYAGKEQQAHELLLEYHHRFRNWKFVIQETWRYSVSNLRLFQHHPNNGRILALLSHILLEALTQSESAANRNLAADHLLALWIKVVEEMPQTVAQPAEEEWIGGASIQLESITAMHQGILRWYLGRLHELPPNLFEHIMGSYYPLKRLAGKLYRLWEIPSSFLELRKLLDRLLTESYRFWLQRQDPGVWLARQTGHSLQDAPWFDLVSPLGHDRWKVLLRRIEEEIASLKDDREAVGTMLDFPDFHDIVRAYRTLPEALKPFDDPASDTHPSMLMRLRIMETKGLEGIHEETLREINFEIEKWVRRESVEKLRDLLERLFEVLNSCLQKHPQAALQIVRTVAMEILDTNDRALIDHFVRQVIQMGFQTPNLGGVSQHWQMQVNPAHLLNVRIWLDIIRKNPARTRTLLSALIVNLSLGGIYIRDTDLFQKDVSELLHAPIRPVYNLVKQLAKLFPVYFNQIGAEGQLRDVSTDIDEITGRADRLIHFLRKQSHVESNNVIVGFIEDIMAFWRTLDRNRIRDRVPPEIFEAVPTAGPLVEEVHRIFTAIFASRTIHHATDLLDLTESQIRTLIWSVPDVSERERQRAFLLIQLYQLLHEKYALSFKDLQVHLQRAAIIGLPNPAALMDAMNHPDPIVKLGATLDYLEELKDVVLNPSELKIQENIYYKRHIAVDIPSMYGSYNERKFDALGLTFRLENLANILFEEIIYSFNLSFITHATFFRIARVLPLFIRALEIDGITSNRLERQEELFQKAIEIRRFSHSQYMDIFRGFSEAIKQIIQTNYHAVHEGNLDLILKQLNDDSLIPRYRREGHGESATERTQRLSESFLRDLIAETFGLQYFDHFISSILTTLATQKEELSIELLDLLLSYDPEKTISMVYDPYPMCYDLIHMGNKAYTLAKLHNLGFRVPPAFVITTEYFRCRSVIESLNPPREDFEQRVMDYIGRLECEMGRRFACPQNSLLLSVRSGSAVSMPGMMNTFLNVGINEQIVEGLIAQTGEGWFAWDNYRRFLQSWGMSFGMQRNEFDAIMNHYKKRYRRQVKREFLPEEIRELALAYRQAILDRHIDFSEDPREQLFTAIRQVMASWHAPKAITYREIMGLSENWGTAVTIQAMVYGNLDTRSGAGVMFTHDPWTSEDKVSVVGDFTLGNQGEDVVGGLVKTLPLSEVQRLSQGERKEHSLETLFPKVYQHLVKIAKDLIYGQNWAPQEIEFTFQGDCEENVYILQSRDMSPRIRRRYPVFRTTERLHSAYVGSGIGVSGGALSGLAAFDLESISRLRKEHVEKPVILLRSDTVPDDIREISIADGILTGKGGATSHAAIVAHRLGKTCVVGFSRMRLWELDKKCTINGHVIHTGDTIGIDGRSGAVYIGYHEIEHVEIVN